MYLPNPAGEEDLSFAAGPRQYLASIYWATTTIATIGYGAHRAPSHMRIVRHAHMLAPVPAAIRIYNQSCQIA